MVKGKLSAVSEDAVNDIMSYAGYRLINLKLHVPFFSAERFAGQIYKIKTNEIILFYRQLALLLESGINITTALELLRGQASNRLLKKVMGDVIDDLRSGSQLSSAMKKHPQVFNAMACRTLGIGEQTGGLETMLRQIADYMEKESVTTKGIKGALMYPIIAGIATIVVVFILIGFVLPAFRDLYGELGAELPAITRAMLSLSDVLRNNMLTIVLGILGVGLAGLVYFKTPSGKYTMDRLVLRIPLLGLVRLLSELARSCRSISLLFNAGLPLTEILPMVVQGVGNRVLADAFNDVHQDMLKGEGLAQPMAKNSLFLPMMVQMVKVGEETGSLDSTLKAVAENYEVEAGDKTKALLGMIQPVMTVIIGGIVGVVAMSMFSAMYSMYGQNF
jgi:type IV pilus assembly protein PilC